MTANVKTRAYAPVIDVKKTHEALKAKIDPLSGECSQEYRNWLDSAECHMLAGLGLYVDVFLQTKSAPADILNQVIASLQNVQKHISEAKKPK